MSKQNKLSKQNNSEVNKQNIDRTNLDVESAASAGDIVDRTGGDRVGALPQRARGRFEQRERAVRSRRSRVRGAPTLAGEEPHGAIDFAVRRRRRGARERADDAVRRRHRRVALSAVRPRRGGRDGVEE